MLRSWISVAPINPLDLDWFRYLTLSGGLFNGIDRMNCIKPSEYPCDNQFIWISRPSYLCSRMDVGKVGINPTPWSQGDKLPSFTDGLLAREHHNDQWNEFQRVSGRRMASDSAVIRLWLASDVPPLRSMGHREQPGRSCRCYKSNPIESFSTIILALSGCLMAS